MGNISNIDSQGKTPKIIYYLYIASMLVGFTAIAGLVLAYMNKNYGPSWVRNHYRYQIRTFWIGFVYIIAVAMMPSSNSFIIIKVGLLIFWGVWVIVRSVKGLKSLNQGRSPDKLESWLF